MEQFVLSSRDTTIDYTPKGFSMQGFFHPNARACGQRYAGTELLGSVPDILLLLPGSFFHARNLSLVGQLPEADTADAVVPEVSVGTAADFAAVIAAAGELGLPRSEERSVGKEC